MSDGAAASGSNSHRDKRQKMEPSEKIKEINRKIIADAAFQGLPVDEKHIGYILLAITEHAGEDYLNILQMKKLLNEKADLKEWLMTSWRKKSFEDVLKLDYLQRSVPPARLSDREERYLQLMRRVFRDAWNVPYIGDYHHILYNNIKKMKGREPYMNICSIVQSSGSGKSRMVDELAKLVFTIPMNIRKEDNTLVTYPPSDELLRKFLVESAGDVEAVTSRYVTFFFHLFSRAADALKMVNVEPSSQSPSEEQFATGWHKMCDSPYRQAFYAEVIQLCEKGPKSTEDATGSLEKLVKALGQRYTGNEMVRVVMYIDEAHELNRGVDNDDRTQLDLLCSVVAEFSSQPFFCLSLSTQSSLRLLAPPADAATSERARKHGGNLRAPITETPFDCAPHVKIYPRRLHLDQLIEIDYLAKWGRPLWWSMLKGKHVVDLEELIGLARMKLLRQHRITNSLSDFKHLTQLAVVDVLLALDFEPSREKTDQQAELVANHMRIAYSVPQYREYFRSGYPSEPLLAEAAARQIYEFQSDPKHDGSDVMVKILAGTLSHSWIDLGQRGEVVMRLLLMRAYMDAVREERPHDLPIFSHGCGFVNFINNLFTPDQATVILDSIPDNVLPAKTTFREAFKNSVVRFTHFVKAGDESVVTTEALFAAFARGMAFICHPTQKYVDFMIPVLLDKSATLQEAAMSAIMIQVKRRAKARGGNAYGFTQENVHLFPKSKFKRNRERPYFVLIAELTGKRQGGEEKDKERSGEEGDKEHGGEEEDEEQGSEDEDEEQDSAQRKGKAKESLSPRLVHISSPKQVIHHPRSTHPRYMATVYGCSGDLYKAVGTRHHHYEQLLASRNFLDEHPRQDPASRAAVMKLKPLWEYGKDSYHWVESKELNAG